MIIKITLCGFGCGILISKKINNRLQHTACFSKIWLLIILIIICLQCFSDKFVQRGLLIGQPKSLFKYLAGRDTFLSHSYAKSITHGNHASSFIVTETVEKNSLHLKSTHLKSTQNRRCYSGPPNSA